MVVDFSATAVVKAMNIMIERFLQFLLSRHEAGKSANHFPAPGLFILAKSALGTNAFGVERFGGKEFDLQPERSLFRPSRWPAFPVGI